MRLAHTLITLMEAIGVHNIEMDALLGEDYKKSIFTKYKTTERHVQDFIRWRYKCVDILLNDLSMEFMKAFEYYLQFVKGFLPENICELIRWDSTG
jgi:hypothetical protein